MIEWGTIGRASEWVGGKSHSDEKRGAAHHGRIVKRTGDGSLIEFRSVVDAVRWVPLQRY